MPQIEEILNDTAHRPYPMPKGMWAYYQEWNRALFLHWIIPEEQIRKHVPQDLIIDSLDGNCYVSLVAFTMEKIRPRFLPAVTFLSDFDEINVRTYIRNDEKPGVYFLNIEAGKLLSTFVAKAISGLPYEKANMHRKHNSFFSENENKGFGLDAEYEVGQFINEKSELDKWLTERYCLYLEKGNKLYRYDIQHKEWDLNRVQLENLHVDYKLGEMRLNVGQIHSQHYSEGVKVVAWNRCELNGQQGF